MSPEVVEAVYATESHTGEQDNNREQTPERLAANEPRHKPRERTNQDESSGYGDSQVGTETRK